ncbi:hypothetical protein DesfrDRAFT_1368 [Solidesulfovibrio fructosivorans JJ]]|uniref:Uncharacterized protein n=1 Tax=Solidesulfovibrio fructosivorans JJ] TaxID=596151 RepID=E1JUR9_SOLFR|nr:hypothetical protein DesfrDRAFT_1368 [Solidesulfovibrio fructosivorans JJ]]
MTALKLALGLWVRDGIISLVAVTGWPRWGWAHRAVDRCEVAAEALRGQEEREGHERA